MDAIFLDWVIPATSGGQAFTELKTFGISAADRADLDHSFLRFAEALRGWGASAGADVPARAEAAAELDADGGWRKGMKRGLAIVHVWLDSMAAAAQPEAEVAVAVHANGYFVIWMRFPAAASEPADVKELRGNVALVLAHLVRVAVNPGVASIGSLRLLDGKSGDEVYEIRPTTLEPVAVNPVEGNPSADILAAAKKLLSDPQVGTRYAVGRSGDGALRPGGLAIVQLASRVERMQDEILEAIASQQDDRASGRGLEDRLVEKISLGFERSSLLLVLSFLVCVFFTTAARSLWPKFLENLGIGEAELMLFSATFFVLCMLRVFAVYGFERLVRDDRQNTPWMFALPERAARAYFWRPGPLVVDSVILVVVWLAIMKWGRGEWLLPFGTPPSSEGNQTLSGVVKAFAWAMPAIGIGAIAHSANRLSAANEANTEERGALDTLVELGRVVRYAERYLLHLERQLGRVLGKESRAFARLQDALPRFSDASDAIDRAKARLEAGIAERKARFVNASAVTVAVIAFIATIGPIAALKPDDVDKSSKPIPILKQAFRQGEAWPEQVIPASLGNVVATPDECDAAAFMGRLQAMEQASGPRSEPLDQPEELFAFTLGHLVKCQQSGLRRALDNTLVIRLDPDLQGYDEIRRLLDGLGCGLISLQARCG